MRQIVLQKGMQILSLYKKFLEEVVPQNKSKFLDSSHMLDQLYHRRLAGSDDYGQLWSIVKMVCSCHMAVDNEIQSLKRRKLELSTDIDSLTASASQLPERQKVLVT